MSFKDYPIAYKMILLCMTTSIASLLLAIVILIGYDQYSFKNTLRQEMTVLAKVIANRSHAALLFGDEELAHTNLATLEARASVLSACIYRTVGDNNGMQTHNLFAEYHSKEEYQSCPHPGFITSLLATDLVHFSEKYFELLEPIKLDNKEVGYLLIRSNLQDAERRLKDYSLVSLLVIIVAGTVALALSMRLEKIISEPLLKLGETARTVARNDDYSLRAEKHGKDEIGQVVDSFNQMLSKIEQEDANLRESEEKFRLFSASSTIGIFQTDIQGRCIYANERLAEISDMELSQILQNGWTSAVYEEDTDRISKAWQRCLMLGESLNINCRFKSNYGDPYWVTGHIGPLTNSKGNAIGFLGTISDISELKKAQLQLEHLAFYDMLTGLANRRLFRDRLEIILANSARHHTNLALVFIDIDHFKHVNDTLGHDSGDALLRIIADRLHHCVRASDTVARLGGDEFTIILVDVKNSLAVSKVAQHILDEIRKPIFLDDQEISVTASLGLVIFPDNGNDAESLIKHADLALYKAKEEGRNNYQFFNEDMNTNLVQHLSLVRDFREALDNDEFVLHYQPQFDLNSGSVVGFEALVRWNSSKRGFVSPGDFIPVAEETGLILNLGEWILEEACKQMYMLINEQLIDANCVMAVNLSAKQLTQEDLVDHIKRILLTTGLSPRHLELEITESMLMENINVGVRNLNLLQDLGVSLSIDDFGTGYSSLGYLKSLPVHNVKVDRSFVKDIPHDKDDMEITAAVIAMSHKLNYKVVAEGIETEEQVKFLKASHCDYGQGFLFSKPLPIEELKVFCSANLSAARA